MNRPPFYWNGVFTTLPGSPDAWAVPRGRPVMYRLHTSPFAIVGKPLPLIMECHIDGAIKPAEGAGVTVLTPDTMGGTDSRFDPVVDGPNPEPLLTLRGRGWSISLRGGPSATVQGVP